MWELEVMGATIIISESSDFLENDARCDDDWSHQNRLWSLIFKSVNIQFIVIRYRSPTVDWLTV